MNRCLQLANLGRGFTAPNPMVGAVLVYDNRIIGEGFHAHYGQEHAEVNCLHNVREEDKNFIPHSTMYVSLEPCAHYGKTPPCADLLIKMNVKKVIVGCVDINDAVAGKGIKRMQEAGIDVRSGLLEIECREMNRRFFTFHQNKRPYIILKWAQSQDGFIGSGTEERCTIIFNKQKNDELNNLIYVKTNQPESLDFILHSLWEMNIQSVLVEGGAKTLQSFIDEGFWNEVRVITNTKLRLEKGISIPVLKNSILVKQEKYFNDL